MAETTFLVVGNITDQGIVTDICRLDDTGNFQVTCRPFSYENRKVNRVINVGWETPTVTGLVLDRQQ